MNNYLTLTFIGAVAFATKALFATGFMSYAMFLVGVGLGIL